MTISKSLLIGLALACTSLSACNKNDFPTSPPVAAVAPPQGKTWSDIAVKTEAGGYLIGNADAKIKLIEFMSLTCSHCAEFADQGSAEMRDKFVNTGKVSYELRNFVRDPQDMAGTLLTHCGAPEKFWEMTDAMLAHQKTMYDRLKAIPEAQMKAANALPPETRFIEIAKNAGLTDVAVSKGLDPAAAQACLADGANSEKIAARVSGYLKEYKLTGTPAFFLNGKPIELNGSGTRWEQMRDILQKSGAR
jgi:protein-disulfide isomerase